MKHGFGNDRVYIRAVEFADKVVFLERGARGDQGFLAGRLAGTAVTILENITASAGTRGGPDRAGGLEQGRRACLRCIPLLVLMGRNGLIGKLTLAALKAEAEGIAESLAVMISREKKKHWYRYLVPGSRHERQPFGGEELI